jgi:hypothetical protein
VLHAGGTVTRYAGSSAAELTQALQDVRAI